MSAVKRAVHLPTEVDYVVWRGVRDDIPVKWQAKGVFTFLDDGGLLVTTGKGPQTVEIGDRIVYSLLWGEIWPTHQGVFLLSYRDKDES